MAASGTRSAVAISRTLGGRKRSAAIIGLAERQSFLVLRGEGHAVAGEAEPWAVLGDLACTQQDLQDTGETRPLAAFAAVDRQAQAVRPAGPAIRRRRDDGPPNRLAPLRAPHPTRPGRQDRPPAPTAGTAAISPARSGSATLRARMKAVARSSRAGPPASAQCLGGVEAPRARSCASRTGVRRPRRGGNGSSTTPPPIVHVAPVSRRTTRSPASAPIG